MSDEEVKELGERFVEVLKEMGIKDVKDCEYNEVKEKNEIWIIK